MGRKHNDVFRLGGESIPAELGAPEERYPDPVEGEQLRADAGSQGEPPEGHPGRRARLGTLAIGAGATAVAVGLALGPRGERASAPPRATSPAAPGITAAAPPPRAARLRPVVPATGRTRRQPRRERRERPSLSRPPSLPPAISPGPAPPSTPLPLSGGGSGGRENFGIEHG